MPTLGSEPSPAASDAASLLSSFLNTQETPSAIPQPSSLPVAPPSTTLPASPLGPTLSDIKEIDPSAQLAKRSRKPLPPIPGRPSKGSNLLRLGIAALFIFGAIGALLFAFKDPLTDLYYQYVAPLFVQAEETEPTPPAPFPSADPVETVQPAIPAPPPKVDPPPAKPVASNPMPPATSLDPDNDKVTGAISGMDAAKGTAKPPAKPQLDPQIPPTPDGSSVPEIVKPAMPALPGELPTAPEPKTSLMEVPNDQASPSGSASLTRPSADLNTATDTPDEAKPAAQALIEFLASDSVEAKRKFILGAGDPQVNSHIERYYGQTSPAAIPVTSIGFIRHDPNPEVGGGMQSVFMVASPEWKYPIPVMVQETKAGFKLDWIAFIEFKDNWLLKFVQGYHETPGRFHVSIKRSHYFDRDVPDLEEKDCFLIQPPQEDFEVAVFVPKKSPLAEMLRRELGWSTQYAYILAEIQWRQQGDNQWVELTAVPQLNWYITTESEDETKVQAKPAPKK